VPIAPVSDEAKRERLSDDDTIQTDDTIRTEEAIQRLQS
jgi:hypothetical protein